MPLHHISLNVTDIEKSRDFYLAALKPLGYKLSVTLLEGKVLGFGVGYAFDFWLASLDAPSPNGSETRHGSESHKPTASGTPKEKTGPLHLAFAAPNRQKVREFYDAAIAAGGKCNGPPGARPEYFATYYGAFVLDPEGRNIEAVCMKPGFWAEPWGFVGWTLATAVVAGAGSGVASWMGWL